MISSIPPARDWMQSEGNTSMNALYPSLSRNRVSKRGTGYSFPTRWSLGFIHPFNHSIIHSFNQSMHHLVCLDRIGLSLGRLLRKACVFCLVFLPQRTSPLFKEKTTGVSRISSFGDIRALAIFQSPCRDLKVWRGGFTRPGRLD